MRPPDVDLLPGADRLEELGVHDLEALRHLVDLGVLAKRRIVSEPSVWAGALGAWTDEPVLDVDALDALPDGALDDGIRRGGEALGLRVGEPRERYEAALRAVAAGVADAVAQLDAGGLPAGGDLWVCGGGTAVPPLLNPTKFR